MRWPSFETSVWRKITLFSDAKNGIVLAKQMHQIGRHERKRHIERNGRVGGVSIELDDDGRRERLAERLRAERRVVALHRRRDEIAVGARLERRRNALVATRQTRVLSPDGLVRTCRCNAASGQLARKSASTNLSMAGRRDIRVVCDISVPM